MKRRLLLDLDDTLLGVRLGGRVQPVYAAYADVLRRFADRMEAIGFSRADVLTYQQAYDVSRCQALGFGDRDRFPSSLVHTYEHFIAAGAWHSHAYDADYVQRVGYSVFTDYPHVPLPGVVKALRQLRSAYDLTIVTKGPVVTQQNKVREAFPQCVWDGVHVLGFKNTEDWARMLSSIPNHASTIAIGNSLVADVAIPLQLGVGTGFFLEETGTSWAYEDTLSAPPEILRRVQTVPNFPAVLDILL